MTGRPHGFQLLDRVSFFRCLCFATFGYVQLGFLNAADAIDRSNMLKRCKMLV
jgi:hypothetical protein